jgi:malonate transporter
MLVVLLGEAAAGPVLMVLALDLIVFSTLIVILVTGSREGQVTYRTLKQCGSGPAEEPDDRVDRAGADLVGDGLDGAGAGERVSDHPRGGGHARCAFRHRCLAGLQIGRTAFGRLVAEFCKLVLHPAAVAFAALVLFPVDTFDAAVMIAAASLPVAGNVYILAQHYGSRRSASRLRSSCPRRYRS